MAGYAAGHGRPDGQERDTYGHEHGLYRTDESAETRYEGQPRTSAKGFLGSLFDVGFTSFVTPKVIKALYLLIMIGTVLAALFYSYVDYRVNAAFGVLTLFVIAPLFTLIILAVWRIFLEFFMVIFRISDDIRNLRERGEFR